jgi:hypothetical protein
MSYQTPGPTREEIDGSTGPVLLDFGTDWRRYCQAAASVVISLREMQSASRGARGLHCRSAR